MNDLDWFIEIWVLNDVLSTVDYEMKVHDEFLWILFNNFLHLCEFMNVFVWWIYSIYVYVCIFEKIDLYEIFIY